MRISVTTLGSDGGMSGIGRYTATLLREWIGNGVDLRVFGHRSDRAAFLGPNSSTDWRDIPERWKIPLASVCWHQAALPAMTRDADVLFLPAGNRRLPLYHSVPAVATVHDCSSLHVEGKYDRARDLYIKQVLPFLMRRLDHIITVSESTRRDLTGYCGIDPSKITVIPLAADHTVFYPRDPEQARADIQRRFGVSGPYLLYTSRIEHPGKNHVRLIEAFTRLKQRDRVPHRLVFVGPDKERADEVHRAAASSTFAADIHFTGAIAAEDLPIFYSAAEALVFPSLYEGFGLPLLEAMACGTPVLCSDRSSLPEVGGAACILFDPDDSQTICDAVNQFLQESPRDRNARIREGIERAQEFSWHRTAASTLQVLHKASGLSSRPIGQLVTERD